MSYKKANGYDASEFIEQLHDVRNMVTEERAKRLAKENQERLLPSFRSGQENAAKRKAPKDTSKRGKVFR